LPPGACRAMSAHPAGLARRLWLGVLPALLCQASAECSLYVDSRAATEGRISSPDVLEDGTSTCAWILYTEDRRTDYKLRLWNNGVSLTGDSVLTLCSPEMELPTSGQAGGSVRCRDTVIASYAADRPMPAEINIPRVEWLMMIFDRTPRNGTVVHISYEWVEVEVEVAWSIWGLVTIALSLLGTCGVAVLLYLAFFVRSKMSRQRGTVGATLSQLTSLAEVQRQQEKERRTLEALGALPTCTWKEDDQAECCLCLEAYEPEQPLRTLPCEHVFHQACIDNWFQARSYTLRTCPLCKRDPVPNLACDEEAVQETPSSHVADGGELVPDQPQAVEIGRSAGSLVIEV